MLKEPVASSTTVKKKHYYQGKPKSKIKLESAAYAAPVKADPRVSEYLSKNVHLKLNKYMPFEWSCRIEV